MAVARRHSVTSKSLVPWVRHSMRNGRNLIVNGTCIIVVECRLATVRPASRTYSPEWFLPIAVARFLGELLLMTIALCNAIFAAARLAYPLLSSLRVTIQPHSPAERVAVCCWCRSRPAPSGCSRYRQWIQCKMYILCFGTVSPGIGGGGGPVPSSLLYLLKAHLTGDRLVPFRALRRNCIVNAERVDDERALHGFANDRKTILNIYS